MMLPNHKVLARTRSSAVQRIAHWMLQGCVSTSGLLVRDNLPHMTAGLKGLCCDRLSSLKVLDRAIATQAAASALGFKYREVHYSMLAITLY